MNSLRHTFVLFISISLLAGCGIIPTQQYNLPNFTSQQFLYLALLIAALGIVAGIILLFFVIYLATFEDNSPILQRFGLTRSINQVPFLREIYQQRFSTKHKFNRPPNEIEHSNPVVEEPAPVMNGDNATLLNGQALDEVEAPVTVSLFARPSEETAVSTPAQPQIDESTTDPPPAPIQSPTIPENMPEEHSDRANDDNPNISEDSTSEEPSQVQAADKKSRIPTWLILTLTILFTLWCFTALFLFNEYQRRQDEGVDIVIEEPIITPEPLTEFKINPTLEPTPTPLPATCTDIKARGGELTDGEYTLYLGHSETAVVTLYCHNMNGTPTEYLSLEASGTNTNFSSINYPSGNLTTQYSKIRINPHTLIVDRSDRTFASTTGNTPSYSQIQFVDYGTAVGCNEGLKGSIFGQANIDLTNTHFAIAESVNFASDGVNNEGSDAVLGSNRQITNLSANGHCGWVYPENNLQLIYLLAESTTNN